jgi:hypothetical protein
MVTSGADGGGTQRLCGDNVKRSNLTSERVGAARKEGSPGDTDSACSLDPLAGQRRPYFFMIDIILSTGSA